MVIVIMHKVTMTSFAITLYGHCCRHHAVGHQVVSDINVVRRWWNNANLLLRLLTAVLETPILHNTKQLDLHHGGVYLVTIDREYSDFTVTYL